MRCSADLLKLYDKLKSKLVISGKRKVGVRTAFHHICKVCRKILHHCGGSRQRAAPGQLEGMPGSRDVVPDALVARGVLVQVVTLAWDNFTITSISGLTHSA